MKRKTSGLLAIVTIALAGCAESAIQPQARCELMTAQICSRAAEAQLSDGTLAVGYSFQPEEARVVPFVVPVMRPDGALAAEVDCYANTNSRSFSIVKSELAIAPTSQESIDYLRDRHMCGDEGSYAAGERGQIQTASALR